MNEDNTNLLSQAEQIISDPNAILSALLQNPKIGSKLQTVEKTFKQEESAWMSKRSTNHSRLARAVLIQVTKEFTLVGDISKVSESNDVSQVVKEISDDWKFRYDLVGKRIREQQRQNNPNMGAASQRASSRRRPIPERPEIPKPPTPEEELENEIMNEMSAWINSGSDNRTQLCEKVKQEYLEDMMIVRNSAEKTKVNDAVLLVDALMLFRAKSLDGLVVKIEERQQRDAARGVTPGQEDTMTRRRGRR